MSEKVLVSLRKQKWEVEPGQSARKIMEELGLDPESFLTLRNGELVDDSVYLQAGDHLRLVAVISGGR